jgi:hypothetical protein|tara:strand:+ start:55 stop:1458 length:1404 start_codon:yes stop_codon:yes gene_type:complete
MNRLIIYIFLLVTFGSSSQELLNFYIEPSATSDAIDLHTVVYRSSFSFFGNYSISNIDNTITIALCYLNTSGGSETIDFQEFEINLPVGHSNYRINIEVYGDNDALPPCSLNNLEDTGTTEFNYPYNPIDKTTIPDNIFEDYLENLGFGDDLTNNNFVFTHRIENILYLFLSNLLTIESLEGINEFIALKDLRFSYNSVTEVDLSSNIMLERLFCDHNPLIQLNVSNNSLLKDLLCRSTSITSLNLTNNVLLESLDSSFNMISSLNLSNNINLEVLNCGNNELNSLNIDDLSNLRFVILSNNQLSSLDFSNNSQLVFVAVRSNSLTTLNLKNGNNANITNLAAVFNNLLNCVDIDDEIAANNGEFPYSQWAIDPGVIYSEDCSLGVDESQLSNNILLFPNPVESVLHIQIQNNISIDKVFLYDMGGRLIYQNADNVNQIDMENLNKGLYFVEIETTKGSFDKKIVKE